VKAATSTTRSKSSNNDDDESREETNDDDSNSAGAGPSNARVTTNRNGKATSTHAGASGKDLVIYFDRKYLFEF
jgi:hypothetical protein